jgi:hypothetical protein
MAMPLTQDELIVLRHLISSESSEEIAATLDWPLQMVRNCTHTLITWVLNGLEQRGRTPTEYLPASPPSRREAEVFPLWAVTSRFGVASSEVPLGLLGGRAGARSRPTSPGTRGIAELKTTVRIIEIAELLKCEQASASVSKL